MFTRITHVHVHLIAYFLKTFVIEIHVTPTFNNF